MNRIRIVNRTRNTVLGDRIRLADRWWLRLRGFLGRPEPEDGDGLLLTPCRGVHMFAMSYALDVLFLDRSCRVVALYPNLPPGGRTPLERDAISALELPVGGIEASGTRIGDLLYWTPVSGVRPAAERESPASPDVWAAGTAMPRVARVVAPADVPSEWGTQS